MKILVSYRAIPQSPGWSTGDMVVKAFRELGHDAVPYAKYYQEDRWVEDAPRQHEDYDLHVYMECNDGDRQYTELKDVAARKTACWLFDTSYYPDGCEALVRYFNFDDIFLANPITIRQYKSVGFDNVHYLPYACDPDLHVRLNPTKTCDVALVGSIRDDRIALAEEFEKEGIKLELIGDVFREEYVDALASSKIIINQNPKQGLGLLNMRHFEAQAAGCLLIEQWCDLKPNIDAGLFTRAFAQDGDAPIICKTYLDNKLDMSLLQKHFLEQNTYKHRCQKLLEKTFEESLEKFIR